jgi:hypothetical protein
MSLRDTRIACMVRTGGSNRPTTLRNIVVRVVLNLTANITVMLGKARRAVGIL